jgi:ketosteroid isomerase-like protein
MRGVVSAELEADVLAVNATFYAAFESGDLDGMRQVWDDTQDVICVHPGWSPVRGAAALHRSWAMVMASTPYIQFILTDVIVSVRGDVASVTCSENVLAAGGETPAAGFSGGQAVATNLFRLTPAGWRLWIHHASPVLSQEHGALDGGLDP